MKNRQASFFGVPAAPFVVLTVAVLGSVLVLGLWEAVPVGAFIFYSMAVATLRNPDWFDNLRKRVSARLGMGA